MEAWLDRGANRAEWQGLRNALELAEGFVFFPAFAGDELAEAQLGARLVGFAADEGLTLCDIELDERSSVSKVLDRLRTAARPALFWMHRGDRSANLDELLTLLNQKREVISKLADAPLVMVMHPQDWEHFRRYAPDFWSIHQMVSRFSPGRVPKRMELHGYSHGSRTRGMASPLHLVSGWRVSGDELARRSPPHFYGRESEISFLVSALGSAGARISISGQPGAGKTALLNAVVPRVAEYFPDGIWWVPCNLIEGEPQDRSRVILERLVGELVSSSAGRRGAEELSRLFKHGTASMAALFVFEDVDDLTAIKLLIPGLSASMLVTTVQPLAGELPGDVIDLGGLGIEAGAALLQSRTSLDAQTARRVASAAGSRPALLTLLATILADEPASASVLIERLTDDAASVGGSEVDAVLDAGVGRVLDAQTARARASWAKLGLFRESFDSLNAAAVLGADAAGEVRSILVELARAGLIEPLASADQYRCFALLRQSARRRLDARDDAEATQVAYCRHVLSGRASLDVDLDVRAAIEWLREQYRDGSQELRDVVLHIVADTAAIWEKNKFADEVMQFVMELLEAEGDAHRLAGVYDWFGGVSLDRHQALGAERWYGKALELGERAGNQATMASAYVGLGDAARAGGDPWRALKIYQKAYEVGVAVLEKLQLSALHRKMGYSAEHIHDHKSAESHFRAALDEASVAGDSGAMAASYRGLAEIAYASGRLDEAQAFAHESMKSSETDAYGYRLLGMIEQRRGDVEAARAWFEKALAASHEVGARDAVARMHDMLGALAAESGDLDAANFQYQRALELWSELEEPDSVMETCLSLAGIAELRGALDEAEKLYQQALGLAGELHDESAEALAYFRMGQLSCKRGDLERAVEYWIQLMREISVEMRQADVIEPELMKLHAAAPDHVKPILRGRWEAAGLEWPVEDEPG